MKNLIAAFVMTLLVFPNPLAAEAPQAVVERLHTVLLEAMRDADKLGFSGRAGLIRPVVDSSFDFATIARIVTGRAWKASSSDQQAAFIEVFRDLSTATYASNFSGFDGESFVTTGSEQARGSVIVKTNLVKADGEEIPLNYMLRESNGRWLIVNVIAQGVSDLSLKRAEYTAVIKSEGFDSLVDRLRGKVKETNQAR